MHQSKYILSKASITFLHYSDDATEDDKQDDDVNNQHLPKDSIYEPINPDSQEGRKRTY